jgi:hypothetical protein
MFIPKFETLIHISQPRFQQMRINKRLIFQIQIRIDKAVG